MIQKVSRVFSLSFSISLDVFSISCNCSIMMSLACRLKLCPVWLKCLSTGMALGSLTSFLWLFNRILKAVSAFPTYWILQSLHSSRYMMKLLLQVVFWNILNVLLVWLLLKCSVFITCLQQSVLEFEKHGEHFPLVNLLVVSSFLFFSIVFPPINCLRFLFLWIANRGLFSNTFLSSGLTFNMCQCFWSIYIYIIIIKSFYLHEYTACFMPVSVLHFPKQWVADYRCMFRILSNI